MVWLTGCAALMPPRPPIGRDHVELRTSCESDADCPFGALCWQDRCHLACDQEEDCWRIGGHYLQDVHCIVRKPGPRYFVGWAGPSACRHEPSFCESQSDDDTYDRIGRRRHQRRRVEWQGYGPGPREYGAPCESHEDCSVGSRCQSEADVAALGPDAPPAGMCVPWCRSEEDCYQWRTEDRGWRVCESPGPHGYCKSVDPPRRR